jgi:hypothetical protein
VSAIEIVLIVWVASALLSLWFGMMSDVIRTDQDFLLWVTGCAFLPLTLAGFLVIGLIRLATVFCYALGDSFKRPWPNR